MNNSVDDIKVKEEPVEEEQQQQQKMDLSSSNIKPESPVSTSKSKETKKLHRKFFCSTFNQISSFSHFLF
jgi:hypothetical protein